MLDGSRVRPGDTLLGLLSDGLHQRLFARATGSSSSMGLKTTSRLPELRLTLGDELLRVHKNYQPAIASIRHGTVHGAAHITGGGS